MPRRSGSESGRSAIHHDLEQRDLALREVEDLGRAQLVRRYWPMSSSATRLHGLNGANHF